jgi:hypothetical protein
VNWAFTTRPVYTASCDEQASVFTAAKDNAVETVVVWKVLDM